MSTTEKVYALMRGHGGYLTTKEARENGIESKAMQRMADRGLIERVAHGLYVGTDIFPDPFYVAQYRCPKGVFSNETALFLHDLSEGSPFRTSSRCWNGSLRW